MKYPGLFHGIVKDKNLLQYYRQNVIGNEIKFTGSPVSGSNGGKPGLPVSGNEIKVLRVVRCPGQTVGSRDYP